MAKRLIDWNLKGSVLVMGKYIDKDTPATELAKFDIKELYPNFDKMNEVQQFYIVYGIKQKLADRGSSETIAEEKVKLAKELWKDSKDGKITATRSNATGAKENKRIATAGREAAKVVSLEGLIAKKHLFPDTFTEDDQMKLTEFLKMVADSKKK